MNRILLLLLMLPVVISPFPLGGNREWSWTLCAFLSSLFTLVWALTRLRSFETDYRFIHPLITALFLFACLWAQVQQVVAFANNFGVVFHHHDGI